MMNKLSKSMMFSEQQHPSENKMEVNKVLSGFPTNEKRHPIAPSLCRQQSRDDELNQVRIGWCQSSPYSPKVDYRRLCKTLLRSTSPTHVSVGWRLPSRQILLKVLRYITTMRNLQSLTLVLHTWIPKWLLRKLVESPTLISLELRCITVGKAASLEWPLVSAQNDENVVPTVLSSVAPSLRTLKLMSCKLDETHISLLCQWTQESHPLEELSVACTLDLSVRALEMLCRDANCLRLDLTSCGLDGNAALAIARTIPLSKSIEELVTPRNHLWGQDGNCSEAFEKLAEVCLRHLKHWNVGFCRLSNDQVHRILELLEDEKCRLKSLSMLGIPQTLKGPLLERALVHNKSLLSLHLYPLGLLCPKRDKILPFVERGLSRNYRLQDLQSGYRSPLQDLYLHLNCAGRVELLRQGDDDDHEDWAKILSRASAKPDVMYWLLRNGVDHLF